MFDHLTWGNDNWEKCGVNQEEKYKSTSFSRARRNTFPVSCSVPPPSPPLITSPELIQNNGHCGTTPYLICLNMPFWSNHQTYWTSWLTPEFQNLVLWEFLDCKSSPTLLLLLLLLLWQACCQYKLIISTSAPPLLYREQTGLLRTRLTYTCIRTWRCTFCTCPEYALNFDWWHSRWEFHIIRSWAVFSGRNSGPKTGPGQNMSIWEEDEKYGWSKLRDYRITRARGKMSLIGTLWLCIAY